MAHKNSFVKAPRYILRKYNVLRIVARLDVATFLDVGCGAGELDCSLSLSGLRGQGIDFSAKAITLADNLRETSGIPKSQLSFSVGDLATVRKQYDLVIACEVLEHVRDDTTMLDSLARHSSKYVLISVPAKQKLYDDSDKAVGHYRRYERDALRALVRSANLEIIEFINYGFPFTNLVRLLRKSSFKKILATTAKDAPESRSKDSGINPVKLPAFVNTLNLERLLWGPYQISRLFNKTDFGDSYLVLCRVGQ